MTRLHPYSSELIDKETLPISLSNGRNRQRAHQRSSGTNKAKKLAKQLTVKARRWK